MDFDDLPQKKSSPIIVGEELYDLSVEELTERLDFLRAEILRVEAEIVNKKAKRSTADSVFKF